MKNEICLFNGNQVSFFLGKEHDMMINATEMAKIFSKKINHFMENESTQKFIEACLNNRNSGYIDEEKNGNSRENGNIEEVKPANAGFLKTENSRFLKEGKTRNSSFLGIESEEDLYTSKQKSGTWMHRILALKFAAWLDPDFEVWVYSTIESLLFGRHVKREQSFERTIVLQKEMDELCDKHGKTGDDFERYLQIQRSLKYEVAFRKSLTVEGLSGMKSLF